MNGVNPTSNTQQVLQTNQATPPNQGTVANTTPADTISSAGEQKTFFTKCGEWVSSVIKSIRNVLSYIPLIGRFFKDADDVEGPIFGPENQDIKVSFGPEIKISKCLLHHGLKRLKRLSINTL